MHPHELGKTLYPAEDGTVHQDAMGGRYTDLGPIGMGGMCEIRRVRDERSVERGRVSTCTGNGISG